MKKFTNFKPSSSPGKRAMLRLVGTKIKFIILLTVLLTGLRIDLYSNCIGCGGQIGGHQPCFSTGQFIHGGACYMITNYPAGVWGTTKMYYAGGCMIHQVFYVNGSFFKEEFYPGGCYCGTMYPPYDEDAYPLSKYKYNSNDPTVLLINNEVTLSKIEVRELKVNGSIVFSKLDSTPANQNVSIPMSIFQAGERYVVSGVNLSFKTCTYLPFKKTLTNIEELNLFCSWGTPDSVDVQSQCVVYIGNDSTMVLVQHLDNSYEIFPGTTDVSVGINPNEVINAYAIELSQNYPNPFCTSTAIDINIIKSSNVRLAIYDIQGKEIERLVDDYLVPGKYQYVWKANGYENGTYYYRLVSDYAVETKKMILLK